MPTTIRLSSPDAALEALSSLVAAAREEAGISIRELADRAGVDKATVVNVEHGRKVSVETAARLLGALGLECSLVVGAADAE